MPVTKDNKKIKSNIDHRWDLLCRVRYNNTIPDIPFKPKFINYPFDNDRYVDYANFSLQTNHKYDLITEVDLDIPIDLIDPTIYQPEDNPTLHPDDEALLYDEVTIPQKKYKSNKNRKRISWLRKTEYLTFDDSQKKANFQSESNKTIIETSGEMYRDVSKQIDVINTQFETVKEEVVNHPSKPGVTTVNVKYVLPDKQTWIYPSIFVAFDTDISKCGYKPENIPLEKLEDAELRGLQDLDKEGGQYLAFFVPTDETMNQRKNVPVSNENEDGNDTFTYLNDREFWWKLKPKTDLEKSDNYFFIDREDGIFYNEFQARINLNKRLNREKSVNIGNLKLYLKHRELNEVEKKEMQTRITLLEEGNDEENDSQSEENDDDEPIDQAKVIEDIFSTSSAESD